jgi:hypothetical protein
MAWINTLDMPPNNDTIVEVSNDGGTTKTTAKIIVAHDIFGNHKLLWVDAVTGVPEDPWNQWQELAE